MNQVISKDGTLIAFDQSGQGPALILVAQAGATRFARVGLSAHLPPHFTVFAYDRCGRGDSGDTAPYAALREVEDLDALITLSHRAGSCQLAWAPALLSLALSQECCGDGMRLAEAQRACTTRGLMGLRSMLKTTALIKQFTGGRKV